ncbi:hypothetical protein [Lacticaseibacillus paracasei]|uniref:hypothetical protein n=1 Tax=Lacticaseibacillus paracasei TaxID=1597 RepID=UPI0020131DEE|nr:hypothetical protein [Lacticaseibacillus paracasei]
MKKSLLVGLSVLSVFLLSSCGNSSNSSANVNSKTQKSESSHESSQKIEIVSGLSPQNKIKGQQNTDSEVKIKVPKAAKYVATSFNGYIDSVYRVSKKHTADLSISIVGNDNIMIYALKNRPAVNDSSNQIKPISKLKVKTYMTSLDSSKHDNENSYLSSGSSESSEASSTINASDYNTGITYDQIARTPDEYKGKNITLTGEVIQVVEGDDETDLRVAVDGNYDNVIMVGYDPDIMNGSRILENDKITFYAESLGTTTYKSTMGGKITVPLALAKKIDDAGTAPDDYGD